MPPQPKDRSVKDKSGYIFMGEDTGKALANYGPVIDRFDSVQKIKANDSPYEIVQDVSVRVPFTQNDYELFRPAEAGPRNFHQTVVSCRHMYMYVGIVRNVIDMMTDFATEDFKFIHPDPKIEAFYRTWGKKVKLADNIKEFVKHLLVDGNCVVKRVTGKLPHKTKNNWSTKVVAGVDILKQEPEFEPEPREIPLRYIHLNIAAMKWMSSPEEQLAGIQQLGYRISPQMMSLIKSNTPEAKELVKALPEDIRQSLDIQSNYDIPLDMSKLFICHNKKDSWEPWATPYLVGVLKDLRFSEKLRLAELAAVDGMINVIRIWKLGDHTNKILPDQAALTKLSNILNTNVGGGAIDIIWDSMIDMKEYYPPVEQILTAEKYTQVNRNILIGLGIPEVLLGGGGGGSFSTSFIQLKTLVEKLKAIREKVRTWLEVECTLVAKAMKFDSIPRADFNNDNLQDESVKQKMIVQLLDRGIISKEAVLNTFGEDFDFEMDRIKAEKDKMQEKGIKPINPLEKTPINPNKMNTDKKSGRPPGSNDSMKRKTKKPSIRTKGTVLFALEAIDAIEEHIIPLCMEYLGIDNARKLTSENKDKITAMRTSLLSCINYGDELTEERLMALAEDKEKINLSILELIESNTNAYIEENKGLPTVTQRKRIEALSWAEYHSEKE